MTHAKKTTTPRIGAHWPEQGGIYAGLVRGAGGQPDYHLIVPTDARATLRDVPWGPLGKDIPNTASRRDGWANTWAMAAHGSELAMAIRALEIDGHRDFYLPAIGELAVLYGNVPELFERQWHWSSTQSSAHSAWGQLFDDGYQYYLDKDSALHARAVRRFAGRP